MKKEYIQIGIIGVGLAALPFLIMSNMKKPAGRPRPPAETAAAVPDPVVGIAAPSKVDNEIAGKQTKRWELPWGRDPFLTVSDSVGKMNEFQLKGISFAKDRKGFAFINDQIVSSGDVIAGYEVDSIEKDRVMLKRGSQTFFLTFPEKE